MSYINGWHNNDELFITEIQAAPKPVVDTVGSSYTLLMPLDGNVGAFTGKNADSNRFWK